MSFNGSGTFVVNSAGQPVVANTVISATVFNALTADLATGLSTCITKDGQTTVTANIPFGNNKITALGAGTAASDAANLGQVQSTAAKLVTVTGTDTITGTMSPALTAYAAGQLFYFIANAANTGAVTINIDGLGAKSITRDGSTALAGGDINSGEFVVIIYDGTRFQMINAANSFGNTTINGTLTVTGNTALQANVSITSTLSVGGTFAVTGAATLGSTLAVTGKSDLPTVSTASINAAVALITTGTVTNLTASGASIASANIGNLQFTAASIASINAGVAVVTNLTATSASIASMNAGVALLTTATVTSLTATGASVASANVGTAVVTGLTVTGASIASVNAGTATLSGNLTLNGGTANGVLYLNGSKVATSGSGFQFDGSNAGIGGAPAQRLTVRENNPADGLLVSLRNDGTSGLTGTKLWFNQNTVDNWNIGQPAGVNAFVFCNSTSSTNERMRLDASGNLGLGVTPSAWGSGRRVLQMGTTPYIMGSGTSLEFLANAYYNGTNWIYNANGAVAYYAMNSGAHTWYTAASGTAGNAITFTSAMTLDASGNLGIGTTSPDTRLQVTYDSSDTSQFNNAASALMLTNTNTTNDNWAQIFFTDSDGGAAAATFGVQYTDHANNYGNLSFATRGTSGLGERGRFTAGGYFKASNNGSYDSSTGSYHEFSSDQDNHAVYVRATNASLSTTGVLQLGISRNTTNNSFYVISYYNGGAAAYRFRVADSGAIATAGGIALGTNTAATSGIGVQFPATQSASSDANTLDDYEEGTWTISITDGTTSKTATAYYTKIGRMVYVQGGVSNIEDPSAFTGNVYVSGLPFTSSNQGEFPISCFINYTDTATTWSANVSGNTQQIRFYRVGANGQDNVQLTGADCNTFTDIVIGGCYNV